MAEVKPLKLVDLGGGAGRLEEFAAGDQVPKAALPALTKTDVGLGNVDNTSDADKPVSTAQQTALNAKAPLESPAFTGNPTAPTPAAADTDTSIATTAFVRAAMGLFGIGAQTISTEVDLDLYKTGGEFVTPATGLLNLPSGWGQGRHIVSVGGGANYTSQLLFGGSANHGRVAQRAWSGTAWSAWRELFHAGNVLGTVSQSGGVPTGAIIERGSNANGEYVRFADGTQECWGSGTGSTSASDVNSFGSTSGTAFYENVVITLPAAFINTNYTVLPAATTRGVTIIGSPNGTSTALVQCRHTGQGVSVPFRYTAKGRWY